MAYTGRSRISYK